MGDPLRLWVGYQTEEYPFINPTKISDTVPWSLTAALTPGGHHVRLYLETEGKITTILSKKDNYVEFFTGENDESGKRKCIPRSALSTPPATSNQAPATITYPGNSNDCPTDIAPLVFQSPTAQGLSPFPVRDPNITANDLGVYVMTWDNRSPTSPPTSQDLSDTFGLAFSVDGLNWTVYSSEMKIQGPFPSTQTSQYRSIGYTGKLRHLVPVFLTNEQIHLYYTAETVSSCSGGPVGDQCPGGPDLPVTSCSSATAISN